LPLYDTWFGLLLIVDTNRFISVKTPK
jgi:hypothetical protein